jgi:hypothetical protein
MVTRIMHRRRRLPPAPSGSVRLPHLLVCVAKVGQGLTLLHRSPVSCLIASDCRYQVMASSNRRNFE